MNPTIVLAAPGSSLTSSLSGRPLLGSIGASGLALIGAYLLLIGVRGKSQRLRIKNSEHAGLWGLVVGTLFVNAGGMWQEFADGVNSVPTSLLGGDQLGLGAVALALAIFTFLHPWKRPLVPALGGIACAVSFGEAAGVWGIPINILRLMASKVHS